jgi:acyl-CoA thioesterase I
VSALALLLVPAACGTNDRAGPGSPLRYVALGDSYTIGTALTHRSQRWPNRLAATFDTAPVPLLLTRNLGAEGYTSQDLIEVELPLLDDLDPEFVTVLIGVNDVVQGVPAATYRAHLRVIFDALRKRLPAQRVLAVTTPDFTRTPSGAAYGDPDTERAAIVANNRILEQVAARYGVDVVDVFDLSERAATDHSLIAADGLHPSSAQHALWSRRIAARAHQLLSDR